MVQVPTPETATGTGYNVNPMAPRWEASGGCEASAVSGVVQDWYIHLQGFTGMYQRKHVWRDVDARTTITPSVEYNYTDHNVTVWTSDKILRNTQFSACMTSLQDLSIQASGSCSTPGYPTDASGWGQNGVFTTSSQGGILRPVRKDAAGNILDPEGFSQQSFNIELSRAPDTYACGSGWDTLQNVKGDLATLANRCPDYCESFMPSLVNI